MHRKLISLLLIIIGIVWVAPAFAQWSNDPNYPLQVNPDLHNYVFSTEITNDGKNGAIVVWASSDNGISSVRAQRLNEFGRKTWPENGLVIADSTSSIFSMTTDQMGGAFITYIDDSGDSSVVKIQHLLTTGQLAWASGGITLNNGATSSFYKTISDQNGGLIICWRQINEGLFAQRIGSDGLHLWADGGVQITSDQNFDKIDMAADTSGGVTVIWEQNWDTVLLQHIDNSGSLIWNSAGVPLESNNRHVVDLALVDNGEGNIFVVYNHLDTNQKLELKELNTISGSSFRYMEVTPDTNTYQVHPRLADDDNGGIFLTWTEQTDPGYYQMYAQRFFPNGARVWPDRGVTVSPQFNTFLWNYALLNDGRGNVYLTYSNEEDFFAQLINRSGNSLWGYLGLRVGLLPTPLDQRMEACVTQDGNLITAWTSSASELNNTVYAQMMDHAGKLGNGKPQLLAVQDVPNDQGGKVSLVWSRSEFDMPENGYIDHYSVWRGVTHLPNSEQDLNGINQSNESDHPQYRTEITNTDTLYWEWLADLPAQGLGHYSYTASTLSDSNGTDTAVLNYMVSAEMNNYEMFTHWYSNPMSGYSIDNLAPAPPTQLVARLNSEAVQLQWKQNSEEDLGQYAIYRSLEPDFDPDTTAVYQMTEDTTFQDINLSDGGDLYYVVEAIDIHGNHSDASNRASVTVTGTQNEKGVVPKQFALQQNYPNPFNPTTTIRYALPKKSLVQLTIYDTRGEIVRTLIEKTESAGYHALEFDAGNLPSGIYFYRITAHNFTQSRKMILLK